MEHTESGSSAPSFAARAVVPLAIAAVMAVTVALRGGVERSAPRVQEAQPQPTTAASVGFGPASVRGGTAQSAACATCGTVESVQAVAQDGFRVRIRMDDGSRRTFSQPTAPGYEVGEKVRIIEGASASRG